MSHNTIRSVVIGVSAGAAVVAAAAAVDIWQYRRAQAQFRALAQPTDPELAALDAEIAARHEKSVASLRVDNRAALAKFRPDLLVVAHPKYVSSPADLSAAQLLSEIEVVKSQLLDARIAGDLAPQFPRSPKVIELEDQLASLIAEFTARNNPHLYGHEPVSPVEERRYALAYDQVHDGREWPHNTEAGAARHADNLAFIEQAFIAENTKEN
ncbi:hypothetical protein [Streptomyces sp. NPDC058664]|uniref:hypothetical protein n=1 Tax=Streptomyces sp. NPDC058664 TaxID=3346585 RepID=UPI00364ABFEC